MSEDNLGAALDNEYANHQKDIAVKTLGSRTHLTIAKIAKLLEHKEHGSTIGSITLDELLVVAAGGAVVAAPASAAKAPAAKAKPAKAAKKQAKAKTNGAAKPAKAAKAAKPAKKQAKAKTNGAAKAAGKGSKPRLVRDVAYKEVKAALKSLKGDCSNGDLVKATDYTAVQIRTFLNELIEKGDVTFAGKGRGTKYSLA
jgi:hypothetical protein